MTRSSRHLVWGLFLLATPVWAQPAPQFGREPGVERRELPPLSGETTPQQPAAPMIRPPMGQVQPPPARPQRELSWQGLSPAQTRELLSKIALPHRSPALQDTIRALLSAPTQDADINALRLGTLYRAGLTDAIVKAGGSKDTIGNTFRARAHLALDKKEQACAEADAINVQRSAPRDATHGEALILKVYCEIMRRDISAASLTVTLARDLDVKSPFIFGVVDALSGNVKAKTESPKTVTVEDYAVIRLAGVKGDEGFIERATPALLGLLARDKEADQALRLAAAERAARLNIIDGRVLADAYRSGQPHDRVQLLREIEATGTPKERAKALQRMLSSAQAAGLHWTLAPVLAEKLKAISPAPSIGWFAESAVRIAALAGDPPLARTWLASIDDKNAAARWRILVEVLSGNGGDLDAALAGARELAIAGGWKSDQLHRLASVLDALLYNVPIPLWEAASKVPQPSGGHLPETGLLTRLSEASSKGERAHAILLAVAALGPEGPAHANLIALGDAVRALKAAGFEAQARRVAFEALYGSLHPTAQVTR